MTVNGVPEPTARFAVPGVSPGRGLLIPLSVSEVKSRCLWKFGSKRITFLAVGMS